MTIDFDDQGADHVISDMCQSADARKYLDKLHYANPNFKATLFAIPAEMTLEQLNWFKANEQWVELAMHGFFHTSNYECEKMTYQEFDDLMHSSITHRVSQHFVKGFKAPGWQISDDCYRWLLDNDWWVADQGYNDDRRPSGLSAYVNHNGSFKSYKSGKGSDGSDVTIVDDVEAWHGHTWNCVGNGIEETFDHVKNLVENADNFQFVSEVLNG